MMQVIDFFERLFDMSDWPPRWHCGRWTGFHGWLYIISDLLVWSAYFAIPFIIIRYISKKQDARFLRLYFLFAAFILACGATHFFDAITFWFPVYRINALIRFITGVLSWITVFYLIRLLPLAFTLRSPRELEMENEQRKKAEEKFRNLLEAAPDPMVIMNENGVIQLVNAQTEKMFGYSREEMIGSNVEMLMPPHSGLEHPFRAFRQTGIRQWEPETEGFEMTGNGRGGMEFPVEVSLRPMLSEEGLLITASIRDVTEKKQMEKAIREANSTLERKVQQRTMELERKNKELEEFAYVASHDLQEPLRTTTSFVDLLRRQYYGQLDDSANRYLDYICQSSDRMKSLILDLLNYSRIGREKELAEVNCNLVLEEVLADLDQGIRENGARVKAPELPVITGYRTEIKQLFQNLVSNSIKFRKPGLDPELHVQAKQENNSWLFSFHDNGIGIEPVYQEKIFVIFKRLHKRSEYEGEGIGLAQCKKIVELHGGKIWVESVPGEGSTFYFTIPEIH